MASNRPASRKSLVPAQPNPDRWEMLRDVVVFQVKLVVDGLRDVVLSPVSLLAALGDLLLSRERTGGRFYEVVRFGRRTERWINLFGAADRSVHSEPRASENGDAGIDAYVEHLQQRLLDQYELWVVTSSAKDKIDRALDTIQHKVRRDKLGPRRR